MKKETIIRTIVLFVALLNQILSAIGKNPLPFSDEEIYSAFSIIFTAVTSIWAWWKNNSFTKNAIKADEYLYELRKGE